MVVSIRCGDHERIGIGNARYEDSGIAGRDDDDFGSYAGSPEHLGEIGWLERLHHLPCGDSEAVPRAAGGKDEKQNVALPIHFFCLGLKRRSKRLDGRVPASLGIETYNNRVGSEPARNDLRGGGRLSAKHALRAEQSE